MDLKEVKRSESESTKVTSSPSTTSKHIKTCSDCHTSRTPLWRGGPSGPKSLCNACGIKYNKKRREALGLAEKGRNEKNKKKKRGNGGGGDGKSSGGGGGGSEAAESLRMKLMALGGEMMLRRCGKLLGKLREEEQAAILLMALSYGSVCA